MSWDNIHNKQNVAGRSKDDEKMDALLNDVFNSEQGRQLIKLLERKYICAPVANPTHDANYAYFREGQNSIIRRFILALKRFELKSNQ